MTSQVYIVSGGTKELVHVQLESAAKSSIASEGVHHSTRVFLRPFMVVAVADVVMVAMDSSDEVGCGQSRLVCGYFSETSGGLAFEQTNHALRVAISVPWNTLLNVQVFARATSTGEPSSSVTVNIGTYTHSVQGNVTSILVSESNRMVALRLADGDLGSTGGLVALDIAVR